MEDLTFTGLGAALGGVALVIGALGSFYMNIKTAKTVKKSAEKIELIDHAVNGKAAGAQTLQSQVDDMHTGDFPPPPVPEYANGAAILPLVQRLVAMMEEQRNKNHPPTKPEEA